MDYDALQDCSHSRRRYWSGSITEGVKVLDEIARLDGGFTFEWTYFPWGCNYYLEKGRMMAEAGVRIKVDRGGVQGSLFAALIAMKQKSCSLSRAAAQPLFIYP